MVERATVFQYAQVAVESTPGTNPAASFRKLGATSIEISPRHEGQVFRPVGSKLATLAAQSKEWAEASISGQASYTDLTWLLAAILRAPTTAQQGSTAAYKHTYDMAQSAPDTLSTLTVEQGGSLRAHSMTYGLVNELGLNFSRDSIEVSGSMLGQEFSDGITMTAGATEPAQKPVLPTQVSVYLADTYAGLAAASALERVLSVNWKLSNRFGPLWPLNAAQTGWAAHVEQVPELSAELLVEADSAGMGLLTQLRSGASKFLRIKAVGELIATSYYYTLQIDTCVKVGDVGEFSDEEGVYAITWPLTGAYDSTWTKGVEVQLTNTVTAL